MDSLELEGSDLSIGAARDRRGGHKWCYRESLRDELEAEIMRWSKETGGRGGAQVANEGQRSAQVAESSGGPTKNIHEVDEAQTSTRPTTVIVPPNPSFFEVSHLISSMFLQFIHLVVTLSIDRNLYPFYL